MSRSRGIVIARSEATRETILKNAALLAVAGEAGDSDLVLRIAMLARNPFFAYLSCLRVLSPHRSDEKRCGRKFEFVTDRHVHVSVGRMSSTKPLPEQIMGIPLGRR